MDNRFKLTGVVIWIGEVKQLSSYFRKCEFKIRNTDYDFSGKILERKIKFGLINENTDKSEALRIDDMVEVEFYIDGRDKIKEGREINFTSLVAYEVNILTSASRDTVDDKKAIITGEGKVYVPEVKEATEEELAGIVKPTDPLLAEWEEKKGNYNFKVDTDIKEQILNRKEEDNPFATIEENKNNDYDDLPF
jgi:hypothetical protein